MPRNPRYRALLNTRSRLPIELVREVFLEAYVDDQPIVLEGPTRSGKSTQIPQFLIHADNLGRRQRRERLLRVIETQPRHVAATSLACHTADEFLVCHLAETSGMLLVASKTKAQTPTCYVYCTNGTVVMKMLNSPLLANTNVMIIDEVHERIEKTDLLFTASLRQTTIREGVLS